MVSSYKLSKENEISAIQHKEHAVIEALPYIVSNFE